MQFQYLLVALGNPGIRYFKTRHNTGFLLADALVRHNNLTWEKHETDSLVSAISLHNSNLLVAKPQTFMNLSGLSVTRLAKKYAIPLEGIIVIHDDLDLSLGCLKISRSRGAGGHRGILSVIENLGSKDFCRIRVGIGRPPEFMTLAEYVLADFSEAEWNVILGCESKIAYALNLFISDGVIKAMNVINGSAVVV